MLGHGVPVLAYLRAPAQDGPVTVPVTAEQQRQERLVRAWAEAHDAQLVASLCDEIRDDGTIDERVHLIEAISRAHDGEAAAICVPSLSTLSPDILVQEFLLFEIVRHGIVVASASPADDDVLADPPSDPERALIRRVMREIPKLEGELRVMRARRKRGDLSSIGPLLADLEAMQEHGDGLPAQDRPPDRTAIHRLAAWLRQRRLQHEETPS